MTDLTQGWGVIRPGDRKAHFYRGHTSLCGRVAFYTGPLNPPVGYSPDDCVKCHRKLDTEVKKGNSK